MLQKLQYINGAMLLITGLYIFTRCGLLKIKNFDFSYNPSNETAMLDACSFMFGLAIMFIGFDLISSFAISCSILLIAAFTFNYLKRALNYYSS